MAADPPARHQLDLRFGDAIAGAALKKVYDTVVRHRGDDRRSDGGPPRRAPRTWCADPPPGGTRSARSPGAVALVLHFGQDRDLLQAAGLQPLDRAERTGRYRVDTPASRGSPRAAPGHARCHGRSARSRRELGYAGYGALTSELDRAAAELPKGRRRRPLGSRRPLGEIYLDGRSPWTVGEPVEAEPTKCPTLTTDRRASRPARLITVGLPDLPPRMTADRQ